MKKSENRGRYETMTVVSLLTWKNLGVFIIQGGHAPIRERKMGIINGARQTQQKGTTNMYSLWAFIKIHIHELKGISCQVSKW